MTSQAAKDYVEKLGFMFQQGGFRLTTILPPPEVFLHGVVEHIVSKKEFDMTLLQDLALYLFVHGVIQEQVGMAGIIVGQAEKAKEKHSPKESRESIFIQHEQELMQEGAATQWCDKCQAHHPISTCAAGGFSLGFVVETQSNRQSALLQLFEGKAHESDGLHAVISAGELDGMITAMKKIRSKITTKAN